MLITQLQVLFGNYALWAAWTSAVSSVNPNNKLSAIGAPALLGEKGGAAEGLARLALTQATESAGLGSFSCTMPKIEVPDVLAELQEILKPHGLAVSLDGDDTLIAWGQKPVVDSLESPYQLEKVPFGTWAHWFAKSVLLAPAEIFTTTNEAAASKLQVPRTSAWLQLQSAVIAGKREETLFFEGDTSLWHIVIANDFRLNGFRFEESQGSGGSLQLKIRIRATRELNTLLISASSLSQEVSRNS